MVELTLQSKTFLGYLYGRYRIETKIEKQKWHYEILQIDLILTCNQKRQKKRCKRLCCTLCLWHIRMCDVSVCTIRSSVMYSQWNLWTNKNKRKLFTFTRNTNSDWNLKSVATIFSIHKTYRFRKTFAQAFTQNELTWHSFLRPIISSYNISINALNGTFPLKQTNLEIYILKILFKSRWYLFVV